MDDANDTVPRRALREAKGERDAWRAELDAALERIAALEANLSRARVERDAAIQARLLAEAERDEWRELYLVEQQARLQAEAERYEQAATVRRLAAALSGKEAADD